MAVTAQSDWRPADAGLAVVLGWLIPGAGHLYWGKRRKALALFVLSLGTYLGGQVLARWKCVFYRSTPMLKSQLWFYGQAGAGLPTALFSLANPARGETDTTFERRRSDGTVEQVRVAGEARLRYEMAPGFELGTLFTTIAGLMNFLVVVDVYDVYYRRKHPRPPAEEEKEPA